MNTDHGRTRANPVALRRRVARGAVVSVVTLLAALSLTHATPAHAQEPPPTQELPPLYLPLVQAYAPLQPIAAGEAFSCAITDAGAVHCWGANRDGQLGDGTERPAPLPVRVLGISGAFAIAAGPDYACAATASGLFCWGKGYGSRAHLVARITALQELAAYPDQTCALGLDQTVTCWTPESAPLLVDGVSGASRLASGLPCAIVAGGVLRCWATGFYEAEGPWNWPHVTDIQAAAYGSFCSRSTCFVTLTVLRPTRTVEQEDRSCLGPCTGEWLESEPIWRPITGSVVELSGGPSNAVCARRLWGDVFCWGRIWDLGHGEAGNGTSFGGGFAQGVSGAEALAVGDRHVCAYQSDGLSCWGSNGSGQLGNPAALFASSAPLRVPLEGAHAAAAWGDLLCALDRTGALFCWGGANRIDPASLAIPRASSIYTPLRMDRAPAQSVAVGDSVVCTLRTGIGVACWRVESWGTIDMIPALVPESNEARALAVTRAFGCFVGRDQHVYCWQGLAGESTAHQVPGASKVESVAAAGTSACAVAEGGVLCWSLARDPETPQPVGVQMPGRVKAIAMHAREGVDRICALLDSGRVACWEESNDWLPSDGAAIGPRQATGVEGIENASAVATSPERVCALRQDGWILCRRTGTVNAVATLRIEGATGLILGDDSLCAQVGDALDCQGSNARGQLARNPGWTPVRVAGVGE